MSKISIEVVNVKTAEERELCQRVRYDVFVKETGYIQKENDRGLETDGYDALDTTIHFLAYFNGIPAGTVRLLFPNRGIAEREGTYYGLPIESLYDIGYYAATHMQIAEISRSCVKERFKSTKTIFNLWKKLIGFAVKSGVTDLVTNVNPETDSLADTGLIYQHIKSNNLMDDNIMVYPKKAGSGKTNGFRFPLTKGSNGDSQTGHSGDFDIELPQTLKLFTRVGALFTGEPVYCEGIDMCALPMNWRLKDIYKSAFGKFFAREDKGAEKAA